MGKHYCEGCNQTITPKWKTHCNQCQFLEEQTRNPPRPRDPPRGEQTALRQAILDVNHENAQHQILILESACRAFSPEYLSALKEPK
jgi:hypothetical protein